jgi:hypothetical protein
MFVKYEWLWSFSKTDCESEVSCMAATMVGRSAKERSLVLVDTFFLNLFIAYLDLTSKALYSLDVCESLSS